MLRYASGDAAAFETLYGRHRGPLYRYLLRQCGNRATADDLFQDTWSKTIAARKRYQPKAKFTTWLYRIAHNNVVDHWRRNARRAPDDVVDDVPTPESQVVRNEQTATLLKAIAGLPLEQRTAIYLHEERGLNLEQIAEVTGCGRETVKSRLRYALAKLRDQLVEPSTGEVA